MPWPVELVSYVNSGEGGTPLQLVSGGTFGVSEGADSPSVIHGHSQTVLRSTSHQSKVGRTGGGHIARSRLWVSH